MGPQDRITVLTGYRHQKCLIIIQFIQKCTLNFIFNKYSIIHYTINFRIYKYSINHYTIDLSILIQIYNYSLYNNSKIGIYKNPSTLDVVGIVTCDHPSTDPSRLMGNAHFLHVITVPSTVPSTQFLISHEK